MRTLHSARTKERLGREISTTVMLDMAPSRLCFGENNGRACRVEWGGAFAFGTCISVVVAQSNQSNRVWRVQANPFCHSNSALPGQLQRQHAPEFPSRSLLSCSGSHGGSRPQSRRRGGQRLSADTFYNCKRLEPSCE